ncbi:unnamed protein product [Meganyctiphanes norvegica]|uniref:Uncharacterized protein n=1 Tax=Meganyctiphanes norvegica TaxID=48144 RepID=A0AAV2Q4V8_MEGNR
MENSYYNDNHFLNNRIIFLEQSCNNISQKLQGEINNSRTKESDLLQKLQQSERQLKEAEKSNNLQSVGYNEFRNALSKYKNEIELLKKQLVREHQQKSSILNKLSEAEDQLKSSEICQGKCSSNSVPNEETKKQIVSMQQHIDKLKKENEFLKASRQELVKTSQNYYDWNKIHENQLKDKNEVLAKLRLHLSTYEQWGNQINTDLDYLVKQYNKMRPKSELSVLIEKDLYDFASYIVIALGKFKMLTHSVFEKEPLYVNVPDPSRSEDTASDMNNNIHDNQHGNLLKKLLFQKMNTAKLYSKSIISKASLEVLHSKWWTAKVFLLK